MSYKVYFGPLTLYGAEKVDVALARPVTVHNGLGFGEYPTPDDRKLREWTVKGQWTEKNDYRLAGWEPAHELIADLKKMMGSDDPERLVMTNGYDKTSVLAYVTDVNATETCAGVYDVTVKLTEYRKPVVRTTGVPAITRPGKIPEMPKTMTFPNASAVGEDALRHSQAQTGELMNELAHTLGMTYTWINTRGDVESTKNPNLVPTNTPVTTIGNQPKDLTLGSYLTDSRAKQSSGTGYGLMTNQGGSWPSKTFDAMDKAINEFSKKSLKERGII